MSTDEPDQGSDARRERRTAQLAQQWAAVRAEMRADRAERAAERDALLAYATGRSNTARAQVPWGVDLAAAWAWRFLVIVAAGTVLVWALWQVKVVTIPLLVALLITALASPLVGLLRRARVPKGLAAGITVVLGLGIVALLVTFVSQQIADGARDLSDQVVTGLGEIRTWLRDGPLHASESQINGYLTQAQDVIRDQGSSGDFIGQVTEVGTALGHVFAGVFIVLFASYFFLADGARIWAWCVRLAPRGARERVDSSGRVAWRSLTQFVRATVVVALVDAIGIMIVAAVLQVPFVLAIGVVVFIGAFVPMIGATVAGTVAVLVALVDQGPLTALLMLAGVIVVQQIEGHVLQPFLMGRFVSVHPLGVIVAIGCGVLVAGIAGALIAVPLVAATNAVVQHLARGTEPGDDPRELVEEEVDRG